MDQPIPTAIKKAFFPEHPANDIKHLLNRTLIGTSIRDQIMLLKKSREEVVRTLLDYTPAIDSVPLKDYDSVQSVKPDFRVPLGASWVADDNHDTVINEKRLYSLKNWIMGFLYKDHPLTIAPKMFLFWADLFGIESRKVAYTPRLFQHYQLIRMNTLTNYKDLLLAVITDESLFYYFNRAGSPGKKLTDFAIEQILGRYVLGPGYSAHISKEKIKRLTRLLNKWNLICDSMVLHYKNLKPLEIYDTENAKYQNAYFNKSEARYVVDELGKLLEKVLKQPACAQYLTRRLFRFFLGSDPSQSEEKTIIEPVSAVWSNSNTDIRAWLNAFLVNNGFYEQKHRGSLPKSELEFLFGLTKELELYTPKKDDFLNYTFWDWLRFRAQQLGLDIADPPSYLGDPAYNSFPYQQRWNSVETLAARNKLVTQLLDTGLKIGDNIVQPDVWKLASYCKNPSDPAMLVKVWCSMFLAELPDAKSLQQIKLRFLTKGENNDAVWIKKWMNTTNPSDAEAKQEVQANLKLLLQFFLTHPLYILN